MVNERLCSLSKSESDFNFVKNHYQTALEKSSYDHKLVFRNDNDQQESDNKKRRRRRKIIYFQPPFSLNVKTPIGRQFLNLVKRHFTPDHPLYKILNYRCLKISYVCMSNIKTEITSNNKRLLNFETDGKNNRSCNCSSASGPCPLHGKCLQSSVVYQADITTAEGDHKVYIGTTGNTFKERYTGHKSSFKHRTKRHTTELSNYYWDLKDQGKTPIIKWSVIRHASSARTRRSGCTLCNTERYKIASADREKLLNKRTERKRLCPHHTNEYF